MSMLIRFATWFDSNYEKIWLGVMIAAIILFALGMCSGNEEIYGLSEDVSDFYDEILSE